MPGAGLSLKLRDSGSGLTLYRQQNIASNLVFQDGVVLKEEHLLNNLGILKNIRDYGIRIILDNYTMP